MKQYYLSTNRVMFLGVLLLLLAPLTSRGQDTQIVLKNDFIRKFKDKVTVEIDFTVDELGKIHSAKQDGDLHFSGRSDAIELPIVGEIMNAKFHKQQIALLRQAQEANNAIKLTGVWRLWCEHAGTGKQVQGEKLEAFEDANPDHVFEIHPVTKVGDESVLASLKPIDGYTKPGAKNRPARAFKQFQKKL